MRVALLTFVIVVAAAFSIGCFYDPDRSHIDLAYDASTPPPVDGGMGAICNGDEDCADYAKATYCAFNPMYPNEAGQCTIANCTAGGCPDGFQCCNCPETIYAEVICMDDASADQVVLYGCSCS